MTHVDLNEVGVVVIGRNEGERLRACLESTRERVTGVVYVDSGSTDGSTALARSLGADVVELDMSLPFTAARARNAGLDRLRQRHPGVELVQMVDGDCEVFAGWLELAAKTLQESPRVVCVCGRRRERQPSASVYNRLCDMEWNTPVGETSECGGDAMFRVDALTMVGGYNGSLIAGEEPELCLRLRSAGGVIMRLDAEMTLHDAQMSRLGQWWNRNVRAGYAYAAGWLLHGRASNGDGGSKGGGYRVSEIRSIVEWAVLIPLLALALAWWTWGASLVVAIALYVWLFVRVKSWRRSVGDAPAAAALYARYCVLGKFPQMIGVARCAFNRAFGRVERIVEYKTATPAAAASSERRS